MPADISFPQRPASPTVVDDKSGKIDKNYRRYASAIERALSLFDSAQQEWADSIPFLGRLLKALQSKPAGVDGIPHSRVVAKRLSQCLNPVLPAGVHQKALEVYAAAFSILGSDGLSQELSVYLPGLSPLLAFASLKVKPTLLSLFETHVVVLEPAVLQPALKAIVLALLPGLEEEGSEEFERTHALLNRFRSAMGQGYARKGSTSGVASDRFFWQSLFLATITNPSRRQGALAYLDLNLPRLGPLSSSAQQNNQSSGKLDRDKPPQQLPPHIEAVASPEPGLLIRCFAAGLQDEQLLVQRGFLDLLVTHLPLHSAILQQKVSSLDLELLVAAAAAVVARREMSLNRRLWVWFLGDKSSHDADADGSNSPEIERSLTPPKVNKDSPVHYFEQYGLEPLTDSLLKAFSTKTYSASAKAKPFRICLSLMDRWEIGGIVIPKVFRPAMESIHNYKDEAPSQEAFSEVTRSAHGFFDGIQSQLIWREMVSLLSEALDLEPPNIQKHVFKESQQRLELVWFVIVTFNISEEEMLSVHLPNALVLIISKLQRLVSDRVSIQNEQLIGVVVLAMRIAAYILDQVPARVLSVGNGYQATRISDEAAARTDGNVSSRIVEYYMSADEQSPLDGRDLHATILKSIEALTIVSLHSANPPSYLDSSLSLLTKLINKSSNTQFVALDDLLSTLDQASAAPLPHNIHGFSRLLGQVAALDIVHKTFHNSNRQPGYRTRNILTQMVVSLWDFISHTNPRCNVEAIRSLWRIHHISLDKQIVEATVISLMLKGGGEPRKQQITLDSSSKFAVLWDHSMTISRPSSKHPPQPIRVDSIIDVRSERSAYDPNVLARPFLLLLDSLIGPKTTLSMFVGDWLQAMPNIHLILDLLVDRLHHTPFLVHLRSTASDVPTGFQGDTSSYSSQQHSVYYIKVISRIIALPSSYIVSSLSNLTTISRLALAGRITGDRQSGPTIEEAETNMTIQEYLYHVSSMILQRCLQHEGQIDEGEQELRQSCVILLQSLLVNLETFTTNPEGLEQLLVQSLSCSVKQSELELQSSLMEVLLLVLKPRMTITEYASKSDKRATSKEYRRSISQISLSTDKGESDQHPASLAHSESALLDCIMLGLSSRNSQPMLEYWVHFLESCLPLYAANILQILLPITGCIIETMESLFASVQETFTGPRLTVSMSSEPVQSLNLLFYGLEQVLAKGHDHTVRDEAKSSSIKSPEHVQGFFGNMVSGVFTAETQAARSVAANNRLTVLLCFKDAVRVAFKIWSWGEDRPASSHAEGTTSASFNYISVRLRNRTRRALEHLFSAEPLECLETLVEAWQNGAATSGSIMDLLHTLEASRPKYAMPAIFNAIYSRTNPTVLDPTRKSTLTSNLSDVDVAFFLVAYTRSMDDDALDEIWTDGMTFLKDVLGNPMPHRQTLPLLLEFVAVLGEKCDNTNFGELRRMRREIGDHFVRLLAGMLTIKPLSFSPDISATSSEVPGENDQYELEKEQQVRRRTDIMAIMAVVLPKMTKILIDTGGIGAAINTISLQLLLPSFHWKTFPHNISIDVLKIMQTTSRVAEAAKTFRKDVAEAFNDTRFFATRSMSIIQEGWMPVMRQWTLVDGERMPEVYGRLSAPTSAGIMFGVGASSARLEADRKAQLNLRRIALLVLSADDDAFVERLNDIQGKLAELMSATSSSSPSSVTRAEIYMVLRALILKITPTRIASLWPLVNAELYDALSSIGQIASRETYNITCILQAAKLLDTLLILAPDDFQLREWLYITDTIDAVYRPSDWKPVALVDGLAEALDSEANNSQSATVPLMADGQKGLRKPLLRREATDGVPREKLLDRVLRPFLRQLSIHAFESTYQMDVPDVRACSEELLKDLFDDSTLV